MAIIFIAMVSSSQQNSRAVTIDDADNRYGKYPGDTFIIRVIKMRGTIMFAFRIEIEVAGYEAGSVRSHLRFGIRQV